MHGINPIDPGMKIDWGNTSEDYSVYRPGPPMSFYQKLLSLGVGLKNQKILDLGTGTGVLARQFAKQGSTVSGTDISQGQIEAAIKLAQDESLNIDFKASPAENCPYPDQSFDVITANQCWLYFDKKKVIPEVKRLLKPGGILVTSHFSWLPRLDDIAKKSEALVLKHNPNWTAADWPGVIPSFPKWAEGQFDVKEFFQFDEPIHFTRESWRGRIRACRGIGAALNEQQVEAFDHEHVELLNKITSEKFTILHRIDAHLFKPL